MGDTVRRAGAMLIAVGGVGCAVSSCADRDPDLAGGRGASAGADLRWRTDGPMMQYYFAVDA